MYGTTFILLLRRVYLTTLCCIVLLISSFSSHAQTVATTVNKLRELPFEGGLTVGDRVPDLVINNIINYKTPGASIKDFKDKLLILDFMTTGCIPCIELLPKLDALQQQFEGKLQVMMVTPEKADRVKRFLENNKFGKQTKLPFVTNDSLFASYFPHEYISHIAWIYNGTVVAITKSQYIKATNIQAVINGDDINWPVKKDVKDYDYSNSLFIHNEDNIPYTSLPATVSYAGFSAHMAGIIARSSYYAPRKSNYIPDSVKKTERFFMINSSIIDMYWRVLNLGRAFPKSKRILEVKDKDKLIYDSSRYYKEVWIQDNTYCYEIIFPFGIPDDKKVEKIRNDLDYYFGMHGRIETRKIKCLVLAKGAPGDSVLKKGFFPLKQEGTPLQNISIEGVLHRLNSSLYACPVLDETGYTEKMNMQLDPVVFSDMNKLRTELKKYGLELKEQERSVEMFVLTEKNK